MFSFKKKEVPVDKVEYSSVRTMRQQTSRVATPAPAVCSDCNGMFVPGSLSDVPTITVVVDYERGKVFPPGTRVFPSGVSKNLYCARCKPTADFLLNLHNVKMSPQDLDDTISFRVLEEGYLERIDEETGEPEYYVSMEQYDRLFCADCGEESTWTKCRSCTSKAARVTKAKKTPTSKKTSSRRRR